MARRGLMTEILFSLLLVVLLALVAATWNAFHALRLFYFEEAAANLEVGARLIEPDVKGMFDEAGAPAMQGLCKEYGKRSGVRVTLVLPSGKVVGDSEEDPAQMDNHADRPEIKTALAGGVGRATRH
ncbi:MAG: PAS domain-containing sensor histidine kinase, partial [Candidatus Hydrogenedentes bacterium]|nr:PAS domain-containing sensor histidine kinase [Candidatus Hydrogenedentota bacterium]